MGFDSEILATVAACEVTGGVAPVFVTNRGFSAIARTGVGDYTLSPETNEVYADAVKLVFVTVKGVVPLLTSIEEEADGDIRIRAFDAAGMAAEVSFYLEAKRFTN